MIKVACDKIEKKKKLIGFKTTNGLLSSIKLLFEKKIILADILIDKGGIWQ